MSAKNNPKNKPNNQAATQAATQAASRYATTQAAVKEKEPKTKGLSTAQDVLNKLVSYHSTYGEAKSSAPKYTKFFLGKDGAYKLVTTELGEFMSKVDVVPGLEVPESSFYLKLESKIPYSILEQIVTFFKDVCEFKGGAEAMIQIYWCRDSKEYFTYCPEQEVGCTSVKFKRNVEYDKKYLLVADVHSHNNMSASFSVIDDKDEQEPRIYGVVGKVMSPHPEMSFRISTGSGFSSIKVFDVFENPFPAVDYPDEWLERCKKHSPSTTAVTSARCNQHTRVVDIRPEEGDCRTHYGRDLVPVSSRAYSGIYDIETGLYDDLEDDFISSIVRRQEKRGGR